VDPSRRYIDDFLPCSIDSAKVAAVLPGSDEVMKFEIVSTPKSEDDNIETREV
jgi:hypothetical protein